MDILDKMRLNSLFTGCVPDDVRHGYFEGATAEELGQQLAGMATLTKDKVSETRVEAVVTEDGKCVAITGNGRHSDAHAQFIAFCLNNRQVILRALLEAPGRASAERRAVDG